jgi:hypothetical protein
VSAATDYTVGDCPPATGGVAADTFKPNDDTADAVTTIAARC